MNRFEAERAVAALIIGDTPEICRVRDLIVRVAASDVPVLVEGPTGAGKELVAYALHAVSGRDGAHVPINVCAIPDGMFEAALFGHVRGAFTGAISDAAGYLTEAHRGTLFLDEIGGLGLQAQAKLLRALETGRFRPVGARQDQLSLFRVVAATNRPLRELVDLGTFRADLAQRLRGFTLEMPPLASRPSDIRLLVAHFLSHETREGVRFDEHAMHLLQRHEWPGNVRELRHVVRCAAALAEGRAIGIELLKSVIGEDTSPHLHRTSSGDRAQLVEVLERVQWNVAEAARLLDVHRATLYRRMRRAGLTSLPQAPSYRTPLSGVAGEPSRASELRVAQTGE